MGERPPIRPVERPRPAAAASYDRLSRWYDLLAASESRFRRQGLALLQASPGEHLLEIGAGTGASLAPICRAAGPHGFVTGVDLSTGMLQQAARRLEAAACPAGLCRADALRLPFPAAAFDGLFMSFVLELFDTPEISLVLAEARRVLHPAGRLVVVALSRRQVTLSVRLYEWAHDRWPALLDCRPIYVGSALLAAGFTVRRRQPGSMWGLPVSIIQARPVP